MIALGIFTLIALFAVFEAWQDFEIISNHEEVEHINAWMVRAFVACYLWGAASIWIGWDAAIYAVASAFLFSSVFRISLNRLRGLDWRYVSPSNWYDWQFICHTLGWVNKMNYQARVREFHGINYFEPVGTPEYPVRIHRAGTIAYTFEVVVLAICIFIAT